jgi:acyl-CoA dehydrogenase
MTDEVDNESFRELLDVVRRFIRERLVPAEREVEERDEVPEAIVTEMKRLGLFGLSTPSAFGGLGLDVVQETEVSLAFGETSPAFRLVFMPNVGLGSKAIAISGTDAQKAKYLPGLASGERRASFCLTEPDAGSDAASLKTTARRVGDGYVINGTKRFISNATRADVFTVMAKTDVADGNGGAISAFIVERGTPGLTIGKAEKKLGQRGAPIADVIFENVHVPAGNLIGGREGDGFRTAMKVLDSGRISVSASAVGMARRMIDEATQYALQRKQFGKSISEFQLIQAMLADSETEFLAGHALTLRAAETLRDGGDTRNLAAAAKYFSSEALSRIADRTLQVFGGAGYTTDYCIERFYRDSRALRIYEGTSQVLQLVIARTLLKNHHLER